MAQRREKPSGSPPQAVDGVDVGTGSVARQGVAVDLEALEGGERRLVHVVLADLEAPGVGDELRGGDLEGLARVVDERRLDGLELQIARHLGVQQHLGEVPARHDELGDNVHVEVTVGTQVAGGSAGLELLVEVGQVEGGNDGSVVVVAVELEDALAFDREEYGDDAFLEAGFHDDGVVFAVGEGLHGVCSWMDGAGRDSTTTTTTSRRAGRPAARRSRQGAISQREGA